MKTTVKLLCIALSAFLLCALLAPVVSAKSGFCVGDVDHDGTLGLGDITLLAKAVAGWNLGDSYHEENADCDADGEVGLGDITLLAKKVAGWDVTLGPDEEFVVNACLASEPYSLDPAYAGATDNATYTLHQFENLMKYEPAGDTLGGNDGMRRALITCGQAASYELSEDLCTYTFTLRDDIFWSDGEPVKAGDFVYAWRRLVDPATEADYGYLLSGIVKNASEIETGEKPAVDLGVRAIDDKTLEIELEGPCAYFLELCAFPDLAPLREDIVEGRDDWTEPGNVVVNGAYLVTEWVHDSYIRKERNPYYYDAANLGPDAIVWWLTEDENEVCDSYASGDYGFILNVPGDKIADLTDSGDCFVNPALGTYFIYLNCEGIADWRVRAAMVLSVDREDLVENVLGGGQTPSTGLVAAGITDSTGYDFADAFGSEGALYCALQMAYPDFDLSLYADRCALALNLYQEAVNDLAFDPEQTLTYITNASGAHQAIAEKCCADWEEVLGLHVTVESTDWASFNDALYSGEFDAARNGWLADYNDATNFLDLLTAGNPALYENAAYNALVSTAKSMAAGDARDQLLYEAEMRLFSEGGFAVCPLYNYTNLYCMNGLDHVGYAFGYYLFHYAEQG